MVIEAKEFQTQKSHEVISTPLASIGSFKNMFSGSWPASHQLPQRWGFYHFFGKTSLTSSRQGLLTCINFLLNATSWPTFASFEPVHLELKFTLQSSNSFNIHRQNYLAFLNLNLAKPALYTWQEDRIFNVCDMKSSGTHEGHNL